MIPSDELAVVIPAKNEEKLLPRLLMSLLKQDYPLLSRTRIFLADADSTDRTLEVAFEAKRDLAISVIRGGLPSVGRNNGARCAAVASSIGPGHFPFCPGCSTGNPPNIPKPQFAVLSKTFLCFSSRLNTWMRMYACRSNEKAF